MDEAEGSLLEPEAVAAARGEAARITRTLRRLIVNWPARMENRK
jgi:hypothetical protein